MTNSAFMSGVFPQMLSAQQLRGPTSQTAIAKPSTNVPEPMRNAIARAAQKTGADFEYLMAQANIESSFNPSAKAPTSSAAGLYQFINSTWLNTLDKHGESLGLGEVADMIQIRGGKAKITDPSKRGAIMALRYDPQASALMAGALANDNRAALSSFLGREPSHGELYLAHFAGAPGAKEMLSELKSNPASIAAAILPGAARANRSMFYKADGSARTVGEFMELIRTKVENAKPGASVSDTPLQPFNLAGLAGISGQFQQAKAESDDAALSWAALASANRAPNNNAEFTKAGYTPPPLPPLKPRPSMAETLRSSFTETAANMPERSRQHIASAYEKLRTLGL